MARDIKMKAGEFETRDGIPVTITAQLPNGQWLGYAHINGDQYLPMVWDNAGIVLGRPRYMLANDIDRAQFLLDKLTPGEQSDVKRIVVAFRTKKIAGIRVLRGTFGWGLVPAQKVFEYAARTVAA